MNAIDNSSLFHKSDFTVDPSVLAFLDNPVEEHFVEFYESDAFLIQSIARFVMSGFARSEAVLVVATASHLKKLEESLTSQGCNLATLKNTGSFITRDAHAVLGEFTKIEDLSFENFSAFVNLCFEQRVDKNQRIRVFGELVSILLEQKRFEMIFQVESLWDQLKEQHDFPLFCAYHIDNFTGADHAEYLAKVCRNHSRVIPTESYSIVVPEIEKMREITLLQQKALSLAHEVDKHRQTEERLRAVKHELEVQLEVSEDLLRRAHVAWNEAEAACRMKDEFLTTISHELRTPLHSIIGWSHMLNSGQLDQETSARALEAIERNAKSQAQVIEDILDASGAITGKLRLNLAPVAPQIFIRAALDSIKEAADTKKLTVETALDSSNEPILGDSNRLQQIVWNLLSNAVKFTPSGGKISVQSKQLDSELEITVRDNGQGIDQQFLPFVFDRFRQADSSTSRRHGGLGLGLAIAKHLVDLHGGRASVASDGIGHGATFKIFLPTLSPRETAELVEDSSFVHPGCPTGLLAGVRVLVVDDDETNLERLGAMLDLQGACFQLAGSADSAMAILHRYLPNVLVLDLEMPLEDGYSLISKIRTQDGYYSRRLPAIALTGHLRVDDRTRALDAGFDMIIPKPVEADELVSAIANLSNLSK